MTTEFVNDPIVPLELVLAGKRYYTLYQPGWYTASDGSAGFLGREHTLYGFRSLDDLVTFVDSGTPNDLTPSPHLKALRIWPTEEYARHLCVYDLSRLAEIADGRLDADEQASLGSTLALMLDLLDYLDIDDEHAQALRDDEDISKLAAGDELLAVFRAGHHRQHVVDLISAHWQSCVSAVSERVTTPKLPDDGPSGPAGPGTALMASSTPADDDGTLPLEEVTNAVTLWFGLADEGFYTVRGTAVDAGHPRYAGRATDAGRRLAVWADLDRMRADLAADDVGLDLDLAAALASDRVSLVPHDDCIFDLVVLAESVTATMDAETADRLVSAWTELVRLAAWGGWDDLADLLAPTAPAGQFVVTVATDLAQDRPGAASALASADVATAAAGWQAVVPALTAHLDQRDHSDG